MKCFIVGLGYFGSILNTKLTKNNYDVTTIDPYNQMAHHKSIDDVKFTNDDRWFVTTPASTHHAILIKLFSKGVKNIWVEKPICPSLEDTLDIFSIKYSSSDDHLYTSSLQYKLILLLFFIDVLLTSMLNDISSHFPFMSTDFSFAYGTSIACILFFDFMSKNINIEMG